MKNHSRFGSHKFRGETETLASRLDAECSRIELKGSFHFYLKFLELWFSGAAVASHPWNRTRVCTIWSRQRSIVWSSFVHGVLPFSCCFDLFALWIYCGKFWNRREVDTWNVGNGTGFDRVILNHILIILSAALTWVHDFDISSRVDIGIPSYFIFTTDESVILKGLFSRYSCQLV